MINKVPGDDGSFLWEGKVGQSGPEIVYGQVFDQCFGDNIRTEDSEKVLNRVATESL